MLANYLTQVRNLLHDPSGVLYSDTSLTQFINEGRTQLAVETDILLGLATVAIAAGTTAYPFSGFSALSSSAQEVIKLKKLVGPSQVLDYRSLEWYLNYYFTSGNTGPPQLWTQVSQGASGSFLIYPTPTAPTQLVGEVCYIPTNLIDDSTPEPLPYPFTDAIQFYACYKALMGAQRYSDATIMFQQFELFLRRARAGSTSDVLAKNQMGSEGGQLANSAITQNGLMPQQGGGK